MLSFCIQGIPDLVVLADMSNFLALLIAEVRINYGCIIFTRNCYNRVCCIFLIQNKKEYQPIKSWRGDPMDSQMGQFLFYLVVSQIRAITAFPYPAPVFGIFMADGHVSFSLC